MIFRQLFDAASSSYTYLLASRPGGEALLIDPVREHCEQYLQLLRELDVQLLFSADTHTHADHITGMGALRDATGCTTLMSSHALSECVSRRVEDGQLLDMDGLQLQVRYTPGHTDDSISLVMADRVFTGDVLLIRGSGRTDFQNGDARVAYDSIFNKLLTLPEATHVYPAHDYKGWTVSTIAEERAFNPRLQVKSAAEYAAIMDNLNLPSPKLMDVAVPANRHCGV